MPASSVILGTAQFGAPYGIANTSGQVSRDAAEELLHIAAGAGIKALDTAVAYGDSERLLGEIGTEGWDVITKLPAVPTDVVDVRDWVDEQVLGSLRRLRRKSLHGLLLHSPAQLRGAHGGVLYRALASQRDAGRTNKIGISIYDPQDLDSLPSGMDFDIVQAPFNSMDMRMEGSGWLGRLKESGCEFHARSIFLQGLLVMPVERIPVTFGKWRNVLDAWHGWLDRYQLSGVEACLRHAVEHTYVSAVVVGIDMPDQLRQIIAMLERKVPLPPLPSEFADVDPELLDPRRWPLQ